MHFLITLATVLGLLNAGALALPDPAAAAVAEPDAAATELDLEERAGCKKVGCNCVGAHQGQYCGYCAAVRGNYVWDSVYECNPSGGCCSYGYRKSCHNVAGPCG
jgi:hypothetical protein